MLLMFPTSYYFILIEGQKQNRKRATSSMQSVARYPQAWQA